MERLVTWWKHQSFFDIVAGTVLSCVIDLLLWLAYKAVGVVIADQKLFFLSTLPLVFIAVGLLGRMVPRRPLFVGRIEHVMGDANPAAPIAHALVIITIRNQGAPSALTDWSVIVKSGEREVGMNAIVPPSDADLQIEDSEGSTVFARGDFLPDKTMLSPVERG